MNGPELIFECEFDERAAEEVELKGFFQHAAVCLPDGRRMKLSFWDPVRLAQDLETDLGNGRTCFAEPGLIVVPRVSVENMRRAVSELYRTGYFDHLENS
jgi:hypothetical protein